MTTGVAYRLVPGTEIIRLDEETLVLKNSHSSVELKGSSADVFEREIAENLDGATSVVDMADRIGLTNPQQLSGLLKQLNEAGVILRAPGGESQNTDFLDYAEMHGLSRESVREHLASVTILVVGLGELGSAIASHLALIGLGELVLFDPDAQRRDGGSQQHWLLENIERSEGLTVSSIDQLLDETQVNELCQKAKFVVSAFGSRLPAADHWVNRAIHATEVPALFCSVSTGKCVLGPVVLPHETACFTCWQMRSLACVDNFRTGMAFEEQRTKREQTSDTQSHEPTYLAGMVAGMAVNELIKVSLAMGVPKLTDRVLEFEPMRGGWSEHAVLRRPDCPVCSKKKLKWPEQPGLTGFPPQEDGQLLQYIDRLVSPTTGIVRTLAPVYKDPSEPTLPYIYRAELANHRYSENDDEAFMVASGKGFTRDSARLSAMGESIERYAASNWDDRRVIRCRAEELDGQILDPERLVLFQDYQYEQLKYDPYDADQVLGWMWMCELATGQRVAAPALATTMAYETLDDEPYLFPITSNGLAAGATLAKAVLAGAYESIERDAFLYTWLNRLPCQQIDPSDHPDSDIRALVNAHARRGIKLELYKVPVNHNVFVFIGIGFAEGERQGPAAVVGLGANHDPASAAASALIEVCQVRPALRMRLRRDETKAQLQSLLNDPQSVTTLEDHDLLYADKSMLHSFDFLRSSKPRSLDWQTGLRAEPLERLSQLNDDLEHLGTGIFYTNLTTQDIEFTGVHVVRVVIPDFQPMHFGASERRLAATRLYQMPVTLGFTKHPSTAKQLNPLPHPLA